jgi:hypothetical protein
MVGDNGAVRVERGPNQLQRFAEYEDPGTRGYLEKRDWRPDYGDGRRRCFSINRATYDGGTGVLRGNRAIGGDRRDRRV